MAAALFGDSSPVERTHFSVAALLLRQHAPRFLPNASQVELNSLSQAVSTLILATDMSKHVRIMQVGQELKGWGWKGLG